MATSSFTREFTVNREKSTEFVIEMSKTASPTLPSDFKPNLVYLQQNIELKSNILTALNT